MSALHSTIRTPDIETQVLFVEALALLPLGQEQRTDVRQVTDQLSQRERERDAALGLARACKKAGERAAGDALASDVSDSEAREMLLRAVAQTGSTPVASISTNQRADPPSVTHRRVPQRHNVRLKRSAESHGAGLTIAKGTFVAAFTVAVSSLGRL